MQYSCLLFCQIIVDKSRLEITNSGMVPNKYWAELLLMTSVTTGKSRARFDSLVQSRVRFSTPDNN